MISVFYFFCRSIRVLYWCLLLAKEYVINIMSLRRPSTSIVSLTVGHSVLDYIRPFILISHSLRLMKYPLSIFSSIKPRTITYDVIFYLYRLYWKLYLSCWSVSKAPAGPLRTGGVGLAGMGMTNIVIFVMVRLMSPPWFDYFIRYWAKFSFESSNMLAFFVPTMSNIVPYNLGILLVNLLVVSLLWTTQDLLWVNFLSTASDKTCSVLAMFDYTIVYIFLECWIDVPN